MKLNKTFGRIATTLVATAMLASMMLPGQILMVPQYLWYEKLGWVGSFAPLIVHVCFALH